MTFSFAKRLECNDSRVRLLAHTFQRGAPIFLLGLFLNLFLLFQFSTVRIPGVLQRIGVCYLIAGAIFLFTRMQIAWIANLLIVYGALMKLAPVPGFGAGSLEKEGNLAQYIDQLVLSGHMWASSKTWDPEGIVSTLPAIATMLSQHLLPASPLWLLALRSWVSFRLGGYPITRLDRQTLRRLSGLSGSAVTGQSLTVIPGL